MHKPLFYRSTLVNLSRLGLAALTMSTLVLLGSAGSAHAVDNGTLGIRPATESDFFHLSAAPGSTLNQVAIVNNYTAEPVTLLTYIVDGLTTEQGAFALDDQNSVPSSVGLWATLPMTSITVPAETEVEIPFSITVPPGTTPGDYVGGLIIQEPLETGDVSTSADGTAVRLDVIHRQGVRIYLNVAGNPVRKLEAGALSWTQSGDTVTVTLAIRNTGNSTLHPTGNVAFSSVLGHNGSTLFVIPESITPGATIILRGTVSTATFIQLGRIDATVSSEAPAIRAATGFINIPWWTLAGLVLALAAIAYFLRRHLIFSRRARSALAREAQAQRAMTSAEQAAAAGVKPPEGRHV